MATDIAIIFVVNILFEYIQIDHCYTHVAKLLLLINIYCYTRL